MKKLSCCLLILAIIFSFALGSAAWADGLSHFEIGTEYGTLELDMDESRWCVLTRDNLKNNPRLKEFGLDPDTEAKYMAENGVYTDAFFYYENSDAYFEIIITENELELEYNFARFSEKLLGEVAECVQEYLDGYKSGVFDNSNGLSFVYCEYKSEDIYERQYYVGMGESKLNIHFRSNEPFIDEEYEEMERFLNSLEFTPKAGAGLGLKIPSLAAILTEIGLDDYAERDEWLSRFNLETGAGTLRLKMDEDFWYVFTRDNLKDNPEVDELGIDPEYQAQFMEENRIILNSILLYDDSDAYLEMLVRETEIENYYDFTKVSDEEFEELAEEIAAGLGREDAEVFKSDKGMKFVNFEFYDSGLYVKEYITLVENRNFVILFQANAPFIDEEYEEMEIILNSFDFTPKAKTKVWADA